MILNTAPSFYVDMISNRVKRPKATLISYRRACLCVRQCERSQNESALTTAWPTATATFTAGAATAILKETAIATAIFSMSAKEGAEDKFKIPGKFLQHMNFVKALQDVDPGSQAQICETRKENKYRQCVSRIDSLTPTLLYAFFSLTVATSNVS